MNFDYLQAHGDLKVLYQHCREAEALATLFPTSSAISSRKAMEFIVKLIYSSCIGTPAYSMTIFEMVTDQAFVDYIQDQTIINTIHIIRKMGNVAAHDGTLTVDEAVNVLEQLHFLVGETCILLGLEADYPEFMKPGTQTAAPAPAAAPKAVPAQTPVAPAKTAEAAKEKVVVAPEIVAKYGPRMRYTHFDVKHGRDESENRELYLKASLREAGWPIVSVPHQSLPGAVGCMIHLDSGDDVDYVMYGKDGKPLAIVEYTATCKSPVEGRMKVIDKANQLNQKYGYKPIAYYTNGYYIFVIDQLGYKPRRVFQFHSIEELELLKLRATIRQDISAPQIDDNITGRYYQKEAITACCKAFMGMRRSSLLVMATGTGKTRVSIALSDVLMKANWAKNILFLADRTSLVRQAHKNFNKLLPNVTTSIYSGTSMNRDPNARIIFSTYQTMINLIDDDTREFGIGRFDLIIIDEAHRSVFNKYGALFHYFDALLIGLTATPRNEENKSTYEVFQLPNGQPDYAYELEVAIADKYLVGFSVLDKTTDKMRRGITYNDLTDEEKASFEDAFLTDDDDETDFTGAEIEARQIGRRVINLGTIDAMLNDLMKNGLKINAGDKIGKTIIFASSHVEAVQIVLRFQKLYAHLGPDFCKLIDSQVEGNLSLIDTFGERDNLPQVAVSVDMMDTGIDVPDVLNLVFFKSVGSKIKFLQMIGRGTRLSADVFGPGMDKQGFLIFDYFDNFRYFSTGNTWSTVESSSDKKTYAVTPQSVLMNRYKLNILKQLQEMAAPSAFEATYRDELQAYFIDTTQLLCNDSVEVQYNMAYVSKYRTAESWLGLTEDRIEEIDMHILPLLPPISAPAKVKSFDMIIYAIEAEYMERIAQGKDPRKIRHGFSGVDKELTERMEELLKLKTIPDIVKKEKLITSMMHGDYLLDDFSLERAEQVRKDLRDLMTYIPDKPGYYIIDTADWIVDPGTDNPDTFVKQKSYAEKAQEYIDHDSPALAKLRNLDELSNDEKNSLSDVFTVQLGTLADYNAWSGSMPLLPFLRIQTGINDSAIQTKFGSFLNSNVLDEAQMTFMQQIIDYARTNGDITAADLLKVSPFCDMDIMGLFGAAKFAYVKQLINGLHKPVM